MLNFRAIAAVAAVAILGFALPVQAANTITLTPSKATYVVGEIVEIEIRMDFDDATFGGKVGVQYDQGLLSYDSFDFDPGLTANVGRVDPADGSTDNPLIIQYGYFNIPSPIGDTAVGTFRFLADSIGMNSLFVSSEIAPSVFRDPQGNPLAVTYGTASINIVPEPSTALLMGLGLVAIGLRRPRVQ
jgi:hypothetical protein